MTMFAWPSMDVLNGMLMGMVAMACVVASMVFIRFWRETLDRFYLFFGLSFGVMAIDRIVLVLVPAQQEWRTMLYWIRLAAYLLILVAIVDKNAQKRKPPEPS